MAVAWEEIEAEIGLLLEEMQGGIEERHAYFLRLKQTLDQMRAYGMPLPDDLLALEEELGSEFEEEAATEGKPPDEDEAT